MSFNPQQFTDARQSAALSRLARQQQQFEANPLLPENQQAEPQDGPTFGRVWKGMVGAGLIQAGIDQVARRHAVHAGGMVDPDFNPYQHIIDLKLEADPAISFLAEQGQFESSFTQEQFDFDLERGRRFMDDMEAMQHSTWTQFSIAMAGTILGDPANLIPGGVAVKTAGVARNASAAQRIAKIAALGAGVNLASEAGLGQLNRAANVEGPANEIFAALAGGLFGAGIGALTTPAVYGMPQRWLSNARHTQLQKNFNRLIESPAVRPAAAGPDGVLAGNDLKLRSLQDELADNQARLKEMIDEPVTELGSVTVLRRKGDGNDTLIKQLETKYEADGGQLVVHRHPDQDFYDLTEDVRSILSHPNMNAEASAADLDYGLIDSVISGATTKYTKVQRIVTPGGRLAGNTLGRLQDAYRTLSGSAQTVTVAQARGKFTHASGTSAEALKELYGGAKDLTLLNMRKIHRAARKQGPITYDGQQVGEGVFGYAGFRSAANDLMRREHAASRGFDVDIPDDVHPAIRQAVDETRRYTLRMRDELEKTGMLEVGPRALAKVEGQLDTKRAAFRSMQSRLTAAQEQTGEGQIDFGGYSATAVRNRVADEFVGATSVADEADQIAATLTASDQINLPDGVFGFAPDDIAHLSATDRAKLAQRFPIAEDYAGLSGFIPEKTRNQIITETLAGKKGRVSNAADDILDDPDNFDPQVVLDAYLHTRYRDTLPEARGGQQVTIRPADLREGDTFRILGDEFVVKNDGGRMVAESDGFVFHLGELDRLPVNKNSVRSDIDFDAATLVQSRLATRLQRKLDRIKKDGERLADHAGGVRKAVVGQEQYLPRVFDVAKIMANEEGFKSKLVDSFRRHDALVDGVAVVDDARPLIREAADNLPAERFDAYREEGVELDLGTLNEGSLDPATRVAYRAELDAYYRRSTQASFDKLTAPTERHGVADGLGPDPIKRRVLEVDETDLQDFLEQDLEVILERYSRVVGGRVAVRRAIQLNPEMWEGTGVTDGNSLFNHLTQSARQLERWGEHADRADGITSSGPAAVAARKLRQRIEKDFRPPLDLLEGRTTGIDTKGVLPYLGRNGIRLQYVNKLGSVFWAQLNDLAPMSLFMMQRRGNVAQLTKMTRALDKVSRRDLEVLGIGFDGLSRSRALADVDFAATGRGLGEGRVRSATAKIENGLLAVGDLHGRVSLMNMITDFSKRISGVMVLDRLGTHSKRLLRADALIRGGMTEKAALRKVGLHGYDAARVNKLGLNVQRGKRYHELVYQNGFTADDKLIREAMTFKEYLASNKVFKAGFDDWPKLNDGDQDIIDTLMGNINAEVNRGLVVTPGVFDRPLINMNIFGRIFNQFQSFGMAFINQRMAAMSQMPAKYQLWYGMSHMALGAMSEAIANHLSGRRSLSESADMWQTNPMGMTYTAFERAGLGGWIGRGMAYADMLGVGPGNLLGNTVGSTSARRTPSDSFLVNVAGPLIGDASRVSDIIGDVVGGEADANTAANLWKLAPFQNLLWFRMAHQATGLPLTPESIRPAR